MTNTGWNYRIISRDGYIMSSSYNRKDFEGYESADKAERVALNVIKDYSENLKDGAVIEIIKRSVYNEQPKTIL